jgi:integrase
MQWEEVDEERNWWTFGAERAKNGLMQRVFLGPQALELLRQLRQSRKYLLNVFPDGRRGRPIENLAKPLACSDLHRASASIS